MVYLAGPLAAVIGIVVIFFVLRRKSVEKRSMYSARRSQIEHKVRAARQRTLAPHGHVEKPPEPGPAATTARAMPQPTVTWERTAYQPPPAAPPAPPSGAPEPAAAPPWEQGPTAPAPAPSSFDFPPASPEPYQVPPSEPFRPAPEPTPRTSPSDPVWTPAPRPAEPLAPAEQVQPAAAASSAAGAGSWSVVSSAKDSSVTPEADGKKKKGGGPTSSWQLASGDSPGADTGEEGEVKASNRTIVAIAQYAVLVVGLVMVLIGVLVMVANSHVT
jgi:hypothetical protein